ncbi:hypothetical protein B0A52_03073 [Exophiala mesophila]|uniref:Zn(2)-C6 fungal-type domain-containing protein n=1 Tax=Exophiala mesophila TaxID=212818 RepID=A0A438NCQ6_EXOME|nr:hypothetical protein B0A52_03073 [Exophiala mesophila]
MGNIGRPSSGCGLCRKRRVKCDEGRPSCRNCTRLNKPCPGYREPGFGLVRTTVFTPPVASQTHRTSSPPDSVATSSSDRQRSSTSESSDSSQSSTSDPVDFKQLLPQNSAVSIPGSVSDVPNLVEQSVWYSLSQIDINSSVLYGNTSFEFIPELLARSSPGSYLHAAMRSVGTINLANRSPTVDLSKIVDSTYQRAISGITRALADPQQCLKDETLVAVFLLSIREILAGATGSSTGSAYRSSMHVTHIEGILMLLRARGDTQFATPEGRHLYATLLSSMHWNPLFDSEEPAPEYLVLEAQTSKAMFVPPAALRLRAFFHGVCKLRHRIKNFLLRHKSQAIDVHGVVGSYLKAAARLEEKVDGWCDIPPWMPVKVDLSTTPRSKYRTPWTSGNLYRLSSFGSFPAFFHWNRYFVTKILLHAAIVDVLSDITPDLVFDDRDVSSLIWEHIETIHDTTREFLGLLGYAFGDVDSKGRVRPTPTPYISDGIAREHRGIDVIAVLQIEPPLTFLVSLKDLGPGQREAIFLALQRIRAEFSLR